MFYIRENLESEVVEPKQVKKGQIWVTYRDVMSHG